MRSKQEKSVALPDAPSRYDWMLPVKSNIANPALIHSLFVLLPGQVRYTKVVFTPRARDGKILR
jgi:hypothetical protein